MYLNHLSKQKQCLQNYTARKDRHIYYIWKFGNFSSRPLEGICSLPVEIENNNDNGYEDHLKTRQKDQWSEASWLGLLQQYPSMIQHASTVVEHVDALFGH